MKGRISKALEWVRVDGKTYRLQVDVTSKVKNPIGRRLAEAG